MSPLRLYDSEWAPTIAGSHVSGPVNVAFVRYQRLHKRGAGHFVRHPSLPHFTLQRLFHAHTIGIALLVAPDRSFYDPANLCMRIGCLVWEGVWKGFLAWLLWHQWPWLYPE